MSSVCPQRYKHRTHFKKVYGGNPEPQTALGAPSLQGPYIKGLGATAYYAIHVEALQDPLASSGQTAWPKPHVHLGWRPLCTSWHIRPSNLPPISHGQTDLIQKGTGYTVCTAGLYAAQPLYAPSPPKKKL